MRHREHLCEPAGEAAVGTSRDGHLQRADHPQGDGPGLSTAFRNDGIRLRTCEQCLNSEPPAVRNALSRRGYELQTLSKKGIPQCNAPRDAERIGLGFGSISVCSAEQLVHSLHVTNFISKWLTGGKRAREGNMLKWI